MAENNATAIPRRLTLGVCVESYADLAKAGRQIERFIRSVDHPHGPFEIDIAVTVGGYIEPSPPPFDVVFTPENSDEDDDGGGWEKESETSA